MCGFFPSIIPLPTGNALCTLDKLNLANINGTYCVTSGLGGAFGACVLKSLCRPEADQEDILSLSV